jgi:transposase
MKPYPLELRQRIVEAVDQKTHLMEEIAELFGVSERYVYKLLALRRQTGDLAPWPHGGGAKAKMDEAQGRKLAALVGEFPDATLNDLQELLQRRCRVRVCVNTSWRALQHLDFTRKKRLAVPRKPVRKSEPPLGRNQ